VIASLNIAQPVGVWDHYIVYDHTVGYNSYNVHLYDILTATDQIIAFGNVRSWGSIGGGPGNGKVGLLYGDDYRIMLYDIATCQTTQAFGSSDRPRMCPSITGTSLIFASNDEIINGAYAISLYDFNTENGQTTTRMTGMPDPHDIQSRGTNTVWWLRTGEYRLVSLLRYSRYDSAFMVISPESVLSDKPRVSDNTVVYHTVIDGTGRINAYDINARTTRQMPGTGSQSDCDVYDGIVVYDDDRYGNRDIYSFDLATGIETRLTGGERDETNPVIWGNYVAFVDNRPGGSGLYVLSMVIDNA
jgi:TolB protein